MGIELLDIGNRIAAFGITDQPDEQKGLIIWSGPVRATGDKYNVDISGRNTSGINFESETVEIEVEDKLNPTKVFWAIYEVAKGLVCPNCSPGY